MQEFICGETLFVEVLVEGASAADVTTAISLALYGNTLTLFDLVCLDV